MNDRSTIEPLYASLAEAAGEDPGRVVLIDDDILLTYGELIRVIDDFARSLLSRCRPGDRVGVLLDSGAPRVVTYYACLRAGVMYTPLFSCPDRVLANVVEGLGLALLVTDATVGVPIPRVFPDTEPAQRFGAGADFRFPTVDVESPAHLLLTSGSTTGTPKAVVTDQVGSVLSHAWRTALCPFEAGDVVGCNVFGIWDAVPALEHAVPVVMIRDAAVRDPLALAAVIVKHGITRMMLTPSLLGACLASPTGVKALRQLRLLVLCGELARPAMLRRAGDMLGQTRLLNLYSIAECHDVAAGFVHGAEARLTPAPFARVRVGDPDDRHRWVAAGQRGRVLVGGPAVALGYLHGVSDRFFQHDGARFYDTGDLGVLYAGGDLSLVGRAETRVKVRGRWVDPEEVSAVLAEHPDVMDVAVRIGRGRVLASVVGRGADLARRVKVHASKRLPAHAVPDRIEQVASLGITASGKAGRAASVREASALETVVLEAFREVLGDRTVGPDHDFTDLGGNSLDAVVLCGVLQARTGHAITVADLLHCGCPRRTVHLLGSTAAAAEEDWRLPGEVPPVTVAPVASPWQHPLVTGGSGFLGAAVALAFGGRAIELARPGMDLDRSRFGLTRRGFEALADRIDGVVHVAARVEPFASFEASYRTNVQGTLELIRLAGIRGVPFHHLSSSAALPLGRNQVWTADVTPSPSLADPLRTSGADAYSYTKLGAELALWRAAERGLPVRIVRVPHMIGHPRRDRLLETLAALCAAGVYPEGTWQWQFVTPELVIDALVARPSVGAPRLQHVALAPVSVASLVTHLGLELQPVPMAAIATALAGVDPDHPYAREAGVLRQLVSEHGPDRALSMRDAILTHVDGDPLTAFERAFERWRRPGPGRELPAG